MTPPNPHQNDELRDEITSIIYGADWKKSDIANAFKPDVEAAMELITQYGDTRELEAVKNVLSIHQISDSDEVFYGLVAKDYPKLTELTKNTESV